MIALLYLIFFGAYLLISVVLYWWVSDMAKKRGIAGWKWGLPMALVMYSLIFWDWLPMEAMFKYDCATESGFTVYKTLDEWKQENPGVAETLVPIKSSSRTRRDGVDWYFLNQRFARSILREEQGLHIIRHEDRVVDRETGEVLARYVDFETDIPPIGLGRKVSGSYKVWMMKRSCESDVNSRKLFSEYSHLLKYKKEIKL